MAAKELSGLARPRSAADTERQLLRQAYSADDAQQAVGQLAALGLGRQIVLRVPGSRQRSYPMHVPFTSDQLA